MELTVYGPLRSATGGKRVKIEADGTVEDVLEALFAEFPRAESHLLDEEGALRPSVRVVQDGESLNLEDTCSPDAPLKVFPAMRGGQR